VLVDGENVPPFQKNKGYFNTGDIPWISTGDQISISVEEYEGIVIISSVGAGTTFVDIVIGGDLTIRDARSSIGFSKGEPDDDTYDNLEGQAALISFREGNQSERSLTESTIGIFESFLGGAEQTSLEFLSELETTFKSLTERTGSLLNMGFMEVRSFGRATVGLGNYLAVSPLVQVLGMSLILVSGLTFVILRRRIAMTRTLPKVVEKESEPDIESSPFWDSRSWGKY
jgi:hypothetical protein